MTYAAHHKEITGSCNHQPSANAAVAGRRGIWRRLFDAIYESRRRHAERDIARLIDRSGGRITDDVEFQMSQRLMTGDWTVRL
jgi:hypothetical protein